MYIVKREVSSNGSRPPLQAWTFPTVPDGYVLCPDKFRDTFYSTNPSGFVNIVVEDGIVTEMTINQEAIDSYLASLPEPEEVIPEPTNDEILNTLLGV
jgi:hypothetical protein